MYLVDLQYFNRDGRYLGSGSMLSPGKEPSAVAAAVKSMDTQRICGIKPTYIYAVPETGIPVLIRQEDFYES